MIGWVLRRVLFLAGFYAVVVLALYLAQGWLLYHPDPELPDVASVGVPGLQRIELESADGTKLAAWYLPPPTETAPVVVFFHGNGGTIAGGTEHLKRFAAAGFGALFPEYPGYGGNPGTPREASLIAAGRAAVAFLGAQGVVPRRIALFGLSLGTGVAVALAAEGDYAALALEAPYSSVADVAAGRYFWAPVRLLIKDSYDSVARIGRVHTPLFLAQGALDTIVPPVFGRRLFDAANEPKQFWSSPDAGHNDLLGHGATDAAITFIRQHVPAG